MPPVSLLPARSLPPSLTAEPSRESSRGGFFALPSSDRRRAPAGFDSPFSDRLLLRSLARVAPAAGGCELAPNINKPASRRVGVRGSASVSVPVNHEQILALASSVNGTKGVESQSGSSSSSRPRLGGAPGGAASGRFKMLRTQMFRFGASFASSMRRLSFPRTAGGASPPGCRRGGPGRRAMAAIKQSVADAPPENVLAGPGPPAPAAAAPAAGPERAKPLPARLGAGAGPSGCCSRLRA
ncbi:hypothetical protein DIPPA_14084 [Diplonema papillatum]|nr:hypothetical protein DIPPA_14084 [Diplonema papillatum]